MPAELFPRSGGVLLHPTSLPGRFGIGDFGPPAQRWVETLAAILSQNLPCSVTFGSSWFSCDALPTSAGNYSLLREALMLVDETLFTAKRRSRRKPSKARS